MTPVKVGELEAQLAQRAPRCSICTLVTDDAVYRRMCESYVQAGFDDAVAEYLYVDNCAQDTDDAYSGITRFLALARGRYVIVCHQDVLLTHDRIEQLDARINEVSSVDPHWALLGNAGGTARSELVMRISDPHGADVRRGTFPAKVRSLDENFLLIRRDASLGVSRDLQGFHFYGLDLCVLAAMRGYSAYVVDFHLTHLSAGKVGPDFDARRRVLIEKYRRDLPGGFYQTTCARLFLTGSRLWSWLLNLKPMLSVARALGKL